jgi:hypothetical protein
MLIAQRRLIANLFGPAGVLPVQRYPDEDGQLEEAEKPGLDDFLAHNFQDPDRFTLADHGVLAGLYAQLLAVEGNTNAVGDAWDAVYDHANANHLEAGKAPWDNAVEQAADAYEANTAAGYAAAADAAWPGMAARPADFLNAVQAKVAKRVADRLRAIADAYTAYTNDNRLLPGTVNAIKAQLLNDFPAGADLAAVNTRLALVYQRQCKVSRENWLTHLGIAGGNLKGHAQANFHYTAFNDTVPNPLPADFRVDNHTVGELLAGLFLQVATDLQIHATRQIGGVRYHCYYDGTWAPRNPNDKLLNDEVALMNREMLDGVTAAKNAHGRVGTNVYGQQLNVGP